MASSPQIFGEPRQADDILADVGLVLLHIKNARGLTLIDMAAVMKRSDDMVARYIAGETEMGFIAWDRAKEAWPEIVERLEETTYERALRAKQRALALDLPIRRKKAA